VNILERALLEKAGREHGWENVVESVAARVVLASAGHRGRATVHAGNTGDGWQIEFPDGRLARELARGLPELAREAGRFAAPDIDRLSTLLRCAAELALSLPDQRVGLAKRNPTASVLCRVTARVALGAHGRVGRARLTRSTGCAEE
jgi:putative restriction endonuclease